MNPVQFAEPGADASVNPAQGVVLLAGRPDLDFVLEGPLPLVWQRTYRSTSVVDGWLGLGWRCPFEHSLQAHADATGQVVSHISYSDAFGRQIEFPALTAGAEHLLLSEQLTLSRSAQGLYKVQDRDGITRWFNPVAGGRHRLSAIVDRNDNAIHLDYVERGGVLQQIVATCSGGQVLHLGFIGPRLSDVQIRRSTPGGDTLVSLVRYHHNAKGDLRGVLDRAGDLVREFEYNDDRLLTRHVHGAALEVRCEYHGKGKESRVVRQWDNAGASATYEYYTDRTVVRDQDDRTTIYHCDELKRWTGFTDAAGRFTQRALDRQGQVRAIVDPAENVSETVFDERGNPVEMRDPDGATTLFEWHAQFALPVAITDALGCTVKYAYDERGNLVAETDPEGAATTYKRDKRGLAIEIQDANGGVKKLAYNQQALLVSYTDCSGHTTRLDYDADGQLVCLTNALGEQTRYEYDAAGRVTRHVLADGSFEAYDYDAAGRLLGVSDALERRTRFEYTPDARLTRRVDALGQAVSYRYDRAQRLTALVNEAGSAYQFAYDILDRLIEETRYDGGKIRYRYDDADNVIERVEAPETSQAIVTRFERDVVGRVLAQYSPNRQVRYDYDAAGQMVRAQEGTIDLHLSYDKAGRVMSEALHTAQRVFKVSHEYDPLGNRLSSVLPDGTKLGSLHYGSGHVHQLRLDDQVVADIERDALHREVQRTQGALLTECAYDPAGRLLRQVAMLKGGASVLERRFTYDRAGRLVLAIDKGRELVYGYDALDRLTCFNEERFAFDPAHNLIGVANGPLPSMGQQENGRITVLEDKRFRYDVHGRLVDKRVGAHKVIEFKWDDAHRLIESTTQTLEGSSTTRYLYDPLGRRIAKKTDVGLTWFVWVEDTLVQQWTDQAHHTFIYEPDTFTPLAVCVRAALPDAPPADIYYYHCDQVGLPRELTDAQGVVRWQGQFSAWGRLSAPGQEDGPSASGVPPCQPLRFEGQYEDEETGLYYTRHRYYDPDIAAFVTPDPLGLDGGDNLYQYGPNPVDWIDPYGLYKKHRKNGQFAGKPGPKKKTDPTHGCSLATTKPAQGYELRDRKTGAVQKYGETTRGSLRYTKAYLKSENVRMVFVEKGTKKEMKDWENKKILAHKAANNGCRPRLNKSDH